MSLLYLNNRDRHLLWEPVWFFGLVGYFDVSQRKRVYLKLSRRENIYMKARKDFLAMKLKEGIFPLHCNETRAFFPSVRICVKKRVLESMWSTR